MIGPKYTNVSSVTMSKSKLDFASAYANINPEIAIKYNSEHRIEFNIDLFTFSVSTYDR